MKKILNKNNGFISHGFFYQSIVRKIGFIFLLLFITLEGAEPSITDFKCPYEAPVLAPIPSDLSPELQLKQIDEDIQHLSNLKAKYLGKAARFQDLGDRLQFHDDYIVESRRYWNLADCATEIADKIQQEIDILKIQKENLLKKLAQTPKKSH
jgi:hypothetical protein